MIKKRKLRKGVKIFICFLLIIICLFSYLLFNNKYENNKYDEYTRPENFEVVESTVSNDLVGMVNSNPNLEFRDFILNDIPILEIKKNDDQTNPVVFILHGLDGYKEGNAYIMTYLAKSGYHVISIDAPSHGERKDAALPFFDIVQKTTKDLEIVIDYFIENNIIKNNDFAVAGFSMGGMSAYYLGTSSTFRPKLIVGMSTCGDFSSLEENYLMKTVVDNGIGIQDDQSFDTNLEIAKQIDPSNNIKKLKDVNIAICHSYDDPIIPFDSENGFYLDLLTNRVNAKIVTYENTGHSIPSDYLPVLLQQLNEVFYETQETTKD